MVHMNTSRKAGLLIGDIICLILGFFGFILVSYGPSDIARGITLHAIPFTLLGILWIGTFFIFNFYELRNSKPNLVFLKKL
jgi:hypothetical protein